ncbi:hypothetical protein I6N90_19970 [Paenibacillus sp. GSMTC-2017]|uniref:beta-ketoacyl synthase N-terminal-like domain-containing protein n=1 Tax=Paenibacillus sp. GSMTC-2017 TaxID=2794350 RepID=UPI0018D863D7|nr:beta-ketoacyl synthase N-terminal-like domain-containing protein [Paenibacillus sp. GSMTC-2017]MBH5320084.1 hypothetical protein [Paenibacillus sp. GSMTC-2017]
MSKSESSVVIVDCRYDLPASNADAAKKLFYNKRAIWENRLLELSRHFNTNMEGIESFDGLFYPSVTEKFELESVEANKARFLLSSERMTLSLFQSLVDAHLIGTKSNLLVSVGSPQTDQLSKSMYLGLEPENFMTAMEFLDPLAYLKQLKTGKSPAIEMISEASTSGIGSLFSSYNRIKQGQFDTAVCGGSCAATSPFPYELSPFGVGNDRFTEPFEQGASGHYYSEGGAAFLLKDKEQALLDGDTILAEIRHIGVGTMRSAVVNRNAVKKLIVASLNEAGVHTDEHIFLDLYGRGNEIDDTAEFSCLRNVHKAYPNLKGGFLKEDVQYVVGYYGLMGLCRLLEAKRDGTVIQGRYVERPNHYIGSIDEEVWAANSNDYHLFSFPIYSMHGNMYHLLIDTDIKGRNV